MAKRLMVLDDEFLIAWGLASELEFLGWEELDDGLRLVEWPERVPALFKTADICLQLDYTETGRRAVLRAYSERGAAWLATLPL